MSRSLSLVILFIVMLIGSSAEAGVRPRLRIKEFNGYARHYANPYGKPDSIRNAGYLWAVYQPHAHRVEKAFNKPELEYGPVWVAKRRLQYTHAGWPIHAYDLLTPDGTAQQVAAATGFFWTRETAPPPVEYYWADRLPPEWFVKKHYDLFYPIEPRKWWARDEAGKWDVIENEKLTIEAGKGPEVEVPRIIFATK